MMSLKFMYDATMQTAVEKSIPTQGVLNWVDRAPKMLRIIPRSAILTSWEEELLSWASKGPTAEKAA